LGARESCYSVVTATGRVSGIAYRAGLFGIGCGDRGIPYLISG
jgi:hypothetical protein